MTSASKSLAAVLVPGALALGACGGADGPSQEDYAAELDEVCKRVEAELRSIGRVRPDDAPELSRQLDRIRMAIDDGIADLRAVERPEGEAGRLGASFVAEFERAFKREFVPASNALERAVKAGDTRRIRAAAGRLQSIDDERTDELARELGSEECAS